MSVEATYTKPPSYRNVTDFIRMIQHNAKFVDIPTKSILSTKVVINRIKEEKRDHVEVVLLDNLVDELNIVDVKILPPTTAGRTRRIPV